MEDERDPLSGAVIGAAIEVHRHLGPGLLESLYHRAMRHELTLRGIGFRYEEPVEVHYKGVSLGDDLRLDLIVENELVVELKAVDRPHPIHEAQLLSYLRLAGLHKGLLLNFNVLLLRDGIKRMVL